MININSELPITLLEKYNESLNDYDFVLFHLYKSEPEYKQYFNRMREEHPERVMIFDNSAYEFYVKGETLDLNEYEQAIIELNPDYYILPDVLMDKEKTLNNTREFIQSHKINIEKYFETSGESAPQPIAVPQGNSIDDFNTCLMLMLNMGCTNIAIPFHNGFFKEEFDECDSDIAYEFACAGYNFCTEDVRYAMGRCMWMKHYGMNILFSQNTKRCTKLHLLGSHCPAEKAYLNILFDFDNDNVTMDTGYPVKCAMSGVELGKEKSKPYIIIDDFIHDNIPDVIQRLIEKNIKIFKGY